MLERVKEIVADTLGTEAEKLTEATSFKADLDADSLDLFEMVIPTEDLEKIATIGDVVAYLEK